MKQSKCRKVFKKKNKTKTKIRKKKKETIEREFIIIILLETHTYFKLEGKCVHNLQHLKFSDKQSIVF